MQCQRRCPDRNGQCLCTKKGALGTLFTHLVRSTDTDYTSLNEPFIIPQCPGKLQK